MAEDMRKRADWMVPADDPILEWFRDSEWGTSEQVHRDVDYAQEYVASRLRALAEHRLLDKPTRGVFARTDNTIAYLDEELDASELEPRED